MWNNFSLALPLLWLEKKGPDKSSYRTPTAYIYLTEMPCVLKSFSFSLNTYYGLRMLYSYHILVVCLLCVLVPIPFLSKQRGGNVRLR